MDEHQFYLQRCTELALLAAKEGESPVGCVVVLEGRVIGEAYEQSRQLKDITRHAEVLAVMDAVRNHGHCIGATLYTNVEPCLLCTYVIRHHKIGTVVFASLSGELGGTRPEYNLLGTETVKAWGAAPVVVHYQV